MEVSRNKEGPTVLRHSKDRHGSILVSQSAADILGVGPMHDIGMMNWRLLLEVAALFALAHRRSKF